MVRGQKARPPDGRVLRHALIDPRIHDDVVRQILIVGSERVAHPRARRRPAGQLKSGVQELRRRIVVHVLRVHRLDEAQIVGNVRGVGQQVADPRAALPPLLELRERPEDRERRLTRRHRREAAPGSDRFGHLLPVHLLEHRFVVHRVDVRDRAQHVQLDHTLRTRREVRRTQRPDVLRIACRPGVAAAQQLRQRECAETDAGPKQERPS